MRTIKITVKNAVKKYGEDILKSENMKLGKRYMQHGKTSVYMHSLNVAYLSLFIAYLFKINVNEKALIRGALLHDYFLYDWHIKDEAHRLHGFTHAKSAFVNAEREFNINDIEKDIILKHMFPLNITPPKYRESVIVCMADKIIAAAEMLYITSLLWHLFV